MLATPTPVRKTFKQSTSSERIRFGIMVALALFTLVIAVLSLSSALNWREQPFIGAMIKSSLIVNAGVPNSEISWPAMDAGLRPGDQLLAVDDVLLRRVGRGSSSSSQPQLNEVLAAYAPGDVVTLRFARLSGADGSVAIHNAESCAPPEGGIATCSVQITLRDFPNGDFMALFGAPFASGVIILVLSIIMIIGQPWAKATFPVVFVSLMMSIYMTTLFNPSTTYEFVRLWLLSGGMISGSITTIALVYPSTLNFISRQPVLRFVPAFLSLLLALYAVANAYTETITQVGAMPRVIGMGMFVGITVGTAILFFFQRSQATNRLDRNRANTVFLGFALALLPAALWALGSVTQILTGEPIATFAVEVAMPFFIIPVLAMSYTLVYEPGWDTDRWVSNTLTYGLMLFALIIAYFLMVLGASLITTGVLNTEETNNPILIVLTIFMVSLLFVPVRTALQSRIDKFYYRTRHDYQSHLEDFGQSMATLAGPDVMIQNFRALLDEVIQPSNTLIFLINRQTSQYSAYGNPQPETDVVFGMGSGVIQLLKNTDTTIYLQPGQPWPPELHADRARLGIIRVMVLAGMPGSDRLNGFICLGPPRSGRNSYNYEELRFIRNLVGQLSVAIERAQVIEYLQESVNELNVLSNVAKAVNSTIEFDDLLELISTQALNLVTGSQNYYFYIVLYDQKTNQLYYAFFLEKDDRSTQYENQKWPLGDDLYSDVVRKSQPYLLTNYAQEIANRGYTFRHEDRDTLAWMGVPLIGRTDTLGVLALGSASPNTRFNSDQLKVFSNIGSLAATAIEKARLFVETTTRARQLSVLNEISQRLVETEGDVEALLNLITKSAVGILNAEAGSLLLTVSEESEELEFKTAIGGTGHELIGQRLPAGHGVVGQVAKTRKYIIVNDISTDKNWRGEVVDDDSFHTSSILAVPLIAKDRVIGVLEMINKRDGEIYLEEDADLLTTFAGQAAIALENARLLQQTDLQLSQRVEQLEVLELIDRELNKTLELKRVAELTIRWAVSQSGATSGLIGVLDDNKQFMEVVAQYGYDPEDLPEGSEGNRWPITFGIVSRVMRTRRADLQPDVSIDPDYALSLRRALSQITVPMFSGNEINAILVLETSREPRLNLLDLDFVQRLAEHASIAIANAQLYEELIRANETKSEFMAFAAHELKNPLTPIRGWADVISGSMAKAMSPEQIQDAGIIIKNNAEQMQNIINDLRDIAASDANQLQIYPEPIELHHVVKDVLITLQAQIDEKGQEVVNRINEHLPMIMADRGRLIQVMLNFLTNANKYGREEGNIIIDAIVNRNFISSRKNKSLGEVLHIVIEDDGIGMKPEDLARLFNEDYFRADDVKNNTKGTGLGMMITKRIIEGHQGEVWAESAHGMGSKFHFVLPLAPESEENTRTAMDKATTTGAD